MAKQWFHDWFNSPYYHLLYCKRDQTEAQNFINNLYTHLALNNQNKALDVACGRGRHAIYLNKLGLNVTGIDLSVGNIQYARQFETDTLQFYVHDMRSLFYTDHFDIALNLFTSFGYFETQQEHIDALLCINQALKSDGLLVMDFFNVHKALPALVPAEVKIMDDIHFHIHKIIEGKNIIKTINFEDKGQDYHFQEVVKAFTLADFKLLFEKSGFEIIQCFGNYQLDDFDPGSADRLIMICKKAHA